MKLIFVSNFLNHHQIPLCEYLKSLFTEFCFVATENISNEGYQRSMHTDYVLRYYEPTERAICRTMIIAADVVIFGACSSELIALRMKQSKLSFLYSERVFKKGTWRRFIPTTRNKIIRRIVQYKNHPLYILSASAYLPAELSLMGFPREKCYRWGYFPEVKHYESIGALMSRKCMASILWAGRFIDWKHPELAIWVARKLRAAKISFTMNIIGSGILTGKLNHMVHQYRLANCVHLLGAMLPDEVRRLMETTSIFLFTSDRQEGWGAVLNEAMNSGCAVVANRAIGSVPYLLKHGENGLIYDTEQEAFDMVKELLDNPERCRQLGSAAYETMTQMWNAETAASRLVHLIEDLKEHRTSELYNEGPCSKERSII